MKTILLTSAGMNVKEEILKILPKPANQVKIAHIITAAKVEADISYLKKDKKLMAAVGFTVEDIDIEGRDEGQLRQIFNDKDIIYVQGGNTFYLLKSVRASGFDKVAKEFIDKGKIYIGVSAGSYIACPSIEMAMWKNQDRNTVGLTDFTALNLVPFLLSVHYQPEYKTILKKAVAGCQYPVKILTDEQAILVQDDKIRLVGKGSEVKI